MICCPITLQDEGTSPSLLFFFLPCCLDMACWLLILFQKLPSAESGGISQLKSSPFPRVSWPSLTHQWPMGRTQRPSPSPQFRTKETTQLQRPPVGQLAEASVRTSSSLHFSLRLTLLPSSRSEITSQWTHIPESVSWGAWPTTGNAGTMSGTRCTFSKFFPGFLLTSCTSYSNASPPESLLCLWRPQHLAIPRLTDTEDHPC